MKTIRKGLSVLLALAVLCAGLAWSGAATDPEDFDYMIRNGGAVVMRYGGADRDITVPDMLGGVPVTSIDVDAFQGLASLEAITLPDSVTELAAEQFSSCISLKTVHFGNALRKIGASAFWNCTSLETITVPDSVTTIGEAAFSDCAALKSASIGSGVTSIPNDLFDMCASLRTVFLGEGVQTVHSRAFPSEFKQSGDLFVFGAETKISAQEMVGFAGVVHCFNGSLIDKAAKQTGWDVVNFSPSGLVATLEAPLYVTVSDEMQTVPTQGLHIWVNYIDDIFPNVKIPRQEILEGYSMPQQLTFDTVGPFRIPVTYDNFFASYTVTVRQRVTETGIEIVSAPRNTVYYASDLPQTFDTDGLRVELVRSDGSREDVTAQCSVSSSTVLHTAGTQQITVTYGDHSAAFAVTVRQAELRFTANGSAASGVYKKKIGLFSAYRKNPVTLAVSGIDDAQIASVTWEIAEGSGMRVDANGVLTYTNIAAGTGVVRVTVRDVHGATHTAQLRVIFYRLNIQLPLRFKRYL